MGQRRNNKFEEARMKKALLKQIKHLDGIIKVLQDIKKRHLTLKDVRKERGWLKDSLKDELKFPTKNDGVIFSVFPAYFYYVAFLTYFVFFHNVVFPGTL